MIGMDLIRVSKHADSKLSLLSINNYLKEEIKKVASSTEFDIWQDDEKVTVMFKKHPISLQTVNKIMHDLQKRRVRIREFTWKEYDNGPIRRGKIEIIVS